MCIAIVKPQGTQISDECLRNCFENNQDGAGIAYAVNGKLYVTKGIFKLDDFIKNVRAVEKIAEGDILIHCRIGTSGKKDKNNCHPHWVNSSTVMIHNGILDIDIPDKSEVSDTILFINEYLTDLPEDFIKNPAILKLIEQVIGKNNKFAFLNNKGESAICNQESGVIDEGIWYSNETYKYNSYYGYRSYSQREILDYFEDYIGTLEDDEYDCLGEYPLIDRYDWILVPFSKENYRDRYNYISLKSYSEQLYKQYQKGFKDFSKRYKIAS